MSQATQRNTTSKNGQIMNGENVDQLFLFDQYISKQLDAKATQEFEQQLQENPTFKESFRHFLKSKELIYKAGYQEEKALFESKREQTTQKHEKAQLQKQKFMRRRRLMMMAAAFVMLLATVFLLMPSSSSSSTPQELFAEYYEAPEIPGFLSIDQDSLLREAYLSFDAKDFKQAQNQFGMLEKTAFSPSELSEIALYQGLSAIELEAYAQARTIFGQADQHQQQVQWFTALSWLKEGNMPEAKQSFQQIVAQEKHYQYSKAQKILEALGEK